MAAAPVAFDAPELNGFEEAMVDSSEPEETFPQAHELAYLGNDFDAHAFTQRLHQGIIAAPSSDPSEIPGVDVTAFKRIFFRQPHQMIRFTESLLLRHPAPGASLVQQADKKLCILSCLLNTITRQACPKGTTAKEIAFKLEGKSFIGHPQ